MRPDEAEAQLASLFAEAPAAPPAVNAAESVVLYGAGDLGKLAAEFLHHTGVKITAALDRKAKPGDKLLDTIPVFAPDSFMPKAETPILVALTTLPYDPIAGELKGRGWQRVLPFYDYTTAFAHLHPLNNGWFAGALSAEDKKNIAAAMAAWGDDWSRAAYLQFLAWRYARREQAFAGAPVTPADRFFIPAITEALHGDEIFIDAGAYDGRVLEKFLGYAPRCREAHLFEADAKTVGLLEQAVARLPEAQRSRVHIHRKALGNRSGKTPWSGGFGMASRLGAPGGDTVEEIRLDDAKLAPGFVKFHLEGGELGAFEGSMETLKKHRPLLAATVYHNRDGLWKTPRFLMRNLENYRFYFRVHSWCGTGAVVYGVPNEK